MQEPASVSGVRFALLGTLMLDGGAGDPLVVPGVRQRALLASLLLSANVPVSPAGRAPGPVPSQGRHGMAPRDHRAVTGKL